MAEGGNIQAFKDGSDADFEIKCTPCGKDNIREDADKYCHECHEYLCRTCTRYHGRLTATKEHKLLDKDDARQGFGLIKTKCHYHADRDIEMYCNTHDMVYCAMCIATDHRSCNGVSKIEDVSKEYAKQADIQSLLDETKIAENKVMCLTVKQKEKFTAIEKQRETIQVKLDDTETRLIERIKDLKLKATEHLNDKYSTLKASLVSSISESSSTAEVLKQTQEQLQSIHNLDTDQQFIKIKLMRMSVRDANKIIKESETNDAVSVEFIENKELTDFSKMFNSLGDVTFGSKSEQKSKQRQQYKMEKKKEINLKLNVDKTTCFISDICKLPDGTIILADHDNKKVKRLDSNHGVKDYCDLDAKPTGICCISRIEIAVKLSNNKIQFLYVGSTLSKYRSIEIVDGGQFGLTSWLGDLWSSSGEGIKVYSSSSVLVTSISTDQNGKSIFKSCVQHMANCTDFLIVTDYSDGAVCLDRDGTVLRELRDSRLYATRGVSVAKNGTVFLCGCTSTGIKIVMFSKDGECLGEVVLIESGLQSPVSICYDEKVDRFFVTCAWSNSLNVLELIVSEKNQ